MDLINRTKTAVRDLDNLNYRKMKKILMAENRDSDISQSSANDYESDINVSAWHAREHEQLILFVRSFAGRSDAKQSQ